MIHPALPALFLALAAPAAAALDAGDDGSHGVAHLIFHEHIVIRLPRLRGREPIANGRETAVPATAVRWREKKGPRCVAVASMAGAMISSSTEVDLVLLGGERVRAKLNGACEPLDFYSGFYLKANSDGMACAGRDTIRVRSGAACDIDTFKKLVAAK